jgi:hypothetical protein
VPNLFDRKEALVIETVSTPYPDTGESGETYDLEIVADHMNHSQPLDLRANKEAPGPLGLRVYCDLWSYVARQYKQ